MQHLLPENKAKRGHDDAVNGVGPKLRTKELEDVYGSRMVSRVVGMLRRIDFFGSDVRQLKRLRK